MRIISHIFLNLQVILIIISLPFSLILNCYLTYGIFSNKLKFSEAILIFKKGLADLLTNYRPIPILPSLSKIFELVILGRLISFFNITNAIVSTQCRFIQNRSTTHAILHLITACFDNINYNKFSALLFLDIKKAFVYFSP